MDIGARLRIASAPKVEMQDSDLGGGDAIPGGEVCGAKNRRGTLIATLNFDDSDDDVFL